ncbi:MAG: TonB-dependent receptor [Gammaproteobacteria bacterium SHHR-1]
MGLEAKYRDPFRLDKDSLATDLRQEQRLFLNYDGRFNLGADAKLGISLEYLDQDDEGTGLDRFGTPYDQIEQETRHFAGATYSNRLGQGTLSLNLGYGSSSATVNRGTVTDETTEFDEFQTEIAYAWEASEAHLINLGAGYRSDDVEISLLSKQADRDVSHVFIQDQWAISEQVELTLGGRYDDYSDFGDTFNPRATLAWRPGDWGLRVSHGTGFKAPTLLNLYMQDMVRGRYLIRGNENLQPEESKTTELALTYGFDLGQVEFIVHDSSLTDLISSQATGNLVGGLAEMVYQNVDQAEISGAEFLLDLEPADDTRLRFGLEYLDARDALSQERLTDRPRWQMHVGLSKQIGRTSLDLRLRHMRDFWATDPVPFASPYASNFTTASLHLDYELSPSINLFGGVDNLFDQEMPENIAFRGTPDDPGARYFFVGVKGSL